MIDRRGGQATSAVPNVYIIGRPVLIGASPACCFQEGLKQRLALDPRVSDTQSESNTAVPSSGFPIDLRGRRRCAGCFGALSTWPFKSRRGVLLPSAESAPRGVPAFTDGGRRGAFCSSLLLAEGINPHAPASEEPFVLFFGDATGSDRLRSIDFPPPSHQPDLRTHIRG